MPWTPWIETAPLESADPEVQALYQRTRNPRTGQLSDTARLASLTPTVAGLINDLQRAVHQSAGGLSRKEQEITALVVAVYNGCVH